MATVGDKEMGPIFSETPVAVKPIHSGAYKEKKIRKIWGVIELELF